MFLSVAVCFTVPVCASACLSECVHLFSLCVSECIYKSIALPRRERQVEMIWRRLRGWKGRTCKGIKCTHTHKNPMFFTFFHTNLENSSMDWCLILSAQWIMQTYKQWLLMFLCLQLWSASVSPSWWQFTFSFDDHYIFHTTPGRISLSLLVLYEKQDVCVSHPLSSSLPLYLFLSQIFSK